MGFIGLPPQDAAPSTPARGELALSLVGRSAPPGDSLDQIWVYADGRVIWRREGNLPEGANELTRPATWPTRGDLGVAHRDGERAGSRGGTATQPVHARSQRYEQRLGSCEETGALASGTGVRCPFDFHLFASDEIGRGPYAGSYFDVTVRDGEIVRGSVTYEVEEFSPEMWEPFAEWVSTTYPDDAAAMYTDGTYTGLLISEQSIRLWGQHVPEYVEEAEA